MELFDVMRTTFAARHFTDDPFSDEAIVDLLEHARFAPSGGNRQPWHVIIVRQPATRRALADSINPTMRRYAAQVNLGENPWNDVSPTELSQEDIDATEVPNFVDPVTQAPVLLAVLADRRVMAAFDQDLERTGIVSGASIYPFVWNILLAARSQGLGGTCTTFAAANEQAVLKLLDAPDHFAIAALIPLGRPVKQLTKLRRRPVATFLTKERFTGAVVEPARQ